MTLSPSTSLADFSTSLQQPKYSSPTLRNFKVAHQRVSLDINFSEQKIQGTADIIIIPLLPHLDYISFDCNDLDIEAVWIEDKHSSHYIHDNPSLDYLTHFVEQYSNETNEDVLYRDNGIEQSHFLREKFAMLNEVTQDKSKCQLIIKIPGSIKIKLQDTSTLVNYTPRTPSFRNTPQTFQQPDSVYTPLKIKIKYQIKKPINGVKFDNFLKDDFEMWNAYTVNNEICSTTSFWMPCVNSLDEKSTWELEFTVPMRVKDILPPSMERINENFDKSSYMSSLSNDLNNLEFDELGESGLPKTYDDANEEDDNHYEEEDEEDDDDTFSHNQENMGRCFRDLYNRKIRVCCSEFSTMKELDHPNCDTKKIFQFQIYNPVAPHHIGWAVGSFNVWTLPRMINAEVNGTNEDENEISDYMTIKNGSSFNSASNNVFGTNGELFENKDTFSASENGDYIPINIYTLPTEDMDEATVLNSTIICQRIIDFYSKEFGSYPFTSYSLVILPSLITETMDFAGMSFINTRLIHPSTVIDSIFHTTNQLAWSLATQWSGVNITPAELNDVWCCLGMAGFMVLQFIKRTYGKNEFKFRLNSNVEKIATEDYGKAPIGSTFINKSRPISISCEDLNFIKLKAPMVLYILDKRMTKTERSFGMSRVLPKIFLQAMSGDLANNSLSARHFQHVCERVNKSKLEVFFQQWVYNSGVPTFHITQRFNRKRMVIEMGIRQCQRHELDNVNKTLDRNNFFTSAINHFEHTNNAKTPYFSGSMTIRIHESDGTPYEHIVEINDAFTKIDIQYNIKYKKLRNRKLFNLNSSTPYETPLNNTSSPMNNPKDIRSEKADYSNILKESEEGEIQKLGNIFLTIEECNSWKLTNIEKTTEAGDLQMQNEVFEWIRIDSDFEWIGKFYLNQPDYMYLSQLQQDGDVEAQLQSINYFREVIASATKPSLIYSSILTRTAMDKRYFYGVRIKACETLSTFVYREHEDFPGGCKHLLKIFQSLFCFDDSNVPKNNDFSNFSNYFIRMTIPKFLSQVKNENGECPKHVKKFLLDILAYNENSENFYDDSHYLSNLIENVVSASLTKPDDKNYIQKVITILDRYESLDRWVPSYQLLITKTIFQQKLILHMSGVYEFQDLNRILAYSLDNEEVRKNFHKDSISKKREGLEDIAILACKIMLLEGGLKNKFAIKYFFEILCFTPNIYIKESVIGIFIDCINTIVNFKMMNSLSDDIAPVVKSVLSSSLKMKGSQNMKLAFINEEMLCQDYQKRTMVPSSYHIPNILTSLKNIFKDYEPLKKIIWDLLRIPMVTLYQRKSLFDIARVLYTLTDSFKVKLQSPRMKKLIAKNLKRNKLVIRRDGILKLHLVTARTRLTQDINNKIKVSLAKTRKRSSTRPTINKIGSLPVRFVKLSRQYKVIHISSQPFNERVIVQKSNSRSFVIKLKYK